MAEELEAVRAGERTPESRIGLKEGEVSGDANVSRSVATAIRAAGGVPFPPEMLENSQGPKHVAASGRSQKTAVFMLFSPSASPTAFSAARGAGPSAF